jgi:hypothetical protein
MGKKYVVPLKEAITGVFHLRDPNRNSSNSGSTSSTLPNRNWRQPFVPYSNGKRGKRNAHEVPLNNRKNMNVRGENG